MRRDMSFTRAALLWAFAAVSLAAFLWLASAAPGAADASQGAVGVSPQAELHGDGSGGLQAGPDDIAMDEDDRVPVQVWTVLGAGGAMAVGLVLFIVRLAAGWVKPAPPPEEPQH